MSNERRAIYELVMGDKYRRRKIQQGKASELYPEWDSEVDTHTTESEKLEFLHGRIDGLLYAWSHLTGWEVSDIGYLLLRREETFWRADYWDWIDLTVVRDAENEVQCPWCGDIYAREELLYIEPPHWSDSEEWLAVCDDCAGRWIDRPRIADAEARRAEAYGGQVPIDAPGTYVGAKTEVSEGEGEP